MKPITIHPGSALVGVAIVVLTAVLSAQQVINSPTVEVRVVEPAVVHTSAHPRDFVRIHEGVPYLVPLDKLLVVKTMGWLRGNGVEGIRVDVNDVPFFEGLNVDNLLYLPDHSYKPGIVLASGSTVKVIDITQDGGGDDEGDAVLLGYLADA